jgi:hypothetical protein
MRSICRVFHRTTALESRLRQLAKPGDRETSQGCGADTRKTGARVEDAIRKDLPNWVNNLLQRAASSTDKGDSPPCGTTGTDQDCIGRWEAP